MPNVRFELNSPGAERVYLAGDFNDWDPTARRMKRGRSGDSTFVAWVDLDPGEHQYKYVVDSAWVCCPKQARIADGLGGENNLVEVPELTV